VGDAGEPDLDGGHSDEAARLRERAERLAEPIGLVVGGLDATASR
jgi:hypothetical protein